MPDDVGWNGKTRQRMIRQSMPSDLIRGCERFGDQTMRSLECLKDIVMTGHLIVTDDGATRVIKLRRPEKKNAITQDMYRAMSDAIDTAQNNAAIRCIIITGGSGVFTAGKELEDFLYNGTANSHPPPPSHPAEVPFSAAPNAQPNMP